MVGVELCGLVCEADGASTVGDLKGVELVAAVEFVRTLDVDEDDNLELVGGCDSGG